MIRRSSFLVAVVGLALEISAHGAEVTFTSQPNRAHLLELFTSEGCSSCPPAEVWLSQLKNEPKLWRDFVPVAFHVDYWDRLGWRDPFASKEWTARQYAYSLQWKGESVYTPGFVLDGREWRREGVPVAGAEMPGLLKIAVAENELVTADFTPAANDKRAYEVHVARLGFGLDIDVKAGENSGRKLQHDFVVLSLVSTPISSAMKQLRLPAGPASPAKSKRGALAAWITEVGRTEPIQAVGGWL